MKNLKVVILTALTAVGLASCGGKEPAHEHLDANTDHVCDTCNEKFSECVDENKDHLCDYCGVEMSEHVDVNHDGSCDYCGATGLEVKHVDNNHDGVCDEESCGATGLEVHHKDEDKNNKCDVCECDIVDETWTLDLSKVQTTFTKGSTFNSKNLKVVITRTDETTKELTGSDLTITKPSLSTTGTKKVTVKFMANGEQKSLQYEIEVVYWTNAEATILSEVSYLADVNLTYPYVQGATVKTNETDWWIELPEATEDDLLNYNDLLTSINKSRNDQDYGKITYKVIGYEIPNGAAEYFDLDPDTAFACLLVPTFYYAQYDFTLRYYDEDELIIVGLNDEGSMIVTNYFVDASLESYFSIIDNGYYFDGDGGFLPGWLDGFNEFFGSEIGTSDWYNRPAANGVLPELRISDTSDDAAVFPFNYKSNYPFNETIQSYDVAVQLFLQMASTDDRTDFVDELVEKGFVVGQPEDIGASTPIYSYPYTLSNKFVGDWEVSVSEVLKENDEELGFYVDILFRAPEEKFSDIRTFTELSLLPLVGINDATISETPIQIATNCLSGSAVVADTDAATYALGALGALTDAGWTIEKQSENAGVYSATVTNYVYKASFKVSSVDGGALVEFEVSGYTPADMSELKIVTDIFQALNDTEDLPVLDDDYTVDENEVYSLTFNTGVKATNVVAQLTNEVQQTWFNTLDSLAAYVPSYLVADGEAGLYYKDSSRTTLNGQASFISSNKQYSLDIVVESVNGELVATFLVGKTMPKNITCEKVIEDIASNFEGDVLEIDEGVFATALVGAFYNLTSQMLTFANLDYALTTFEDYGFIPSYFVKVGERTTVDEEEESYLFDTYVSLDGTMILEVVAYFEVDSEPEDPSKPYIITIQYTCYLAE